MQTVQTKNNGNRFIEQYEWTIRIGVYGSLCGGMRTTCPNHFKRLLDTSSQMVVMNNRRVYNCKSANVERLWTCRSANVANKELNLKRRKMMNSEQWFYFSVHLTDGQFLWKFDIFFKLHRHNSGIYKVSTICNTPNFYEFKL